MRKKLPHDEKRSNIIGIKVKPETKRKLAYIAKREGTQISTYIDTQLVKHVDQYLQIAHIDWDKLPEDEKEGKEVDG